jgi:hypothetical protein
LNLPAPGNAGFSQALLRESVEGILPGGFEAGRAVLCRESVSKNQGRNRLHSEPSASAA